MPRVGEVNGVAVYVYFNDHTPPHFHGREAGEEVLVTIRDFAVLEGEIPSLRDLIAWGRRNQGLLIAKWNEFNPTNLY
jgi:hypothetical protein